MAKCKRISFSIVLLLNFLFSFASFAAPPKPQNNLRSSREQSWNLKDVDIRVVINQVAKATGKNFLVDPRVKGNVTIIAPGKLSPDEIYQIFLGMLQVHGFNAVQGKNIVKIVPDAESKTMAPYSGYTRQPKNEEISQVQVLRVRNVPVREMAQALKSLVDKTSVIAPYSPSNDLIVSDRVANIKRIAHLVEELDKPTSDDTEVIPLRHASPSDVVAMIETLENTSKSSGSGGVTAFRSQLEQEQVRLAADERTNSVLVGGAPGKRLRIRALIKKMDVPSRNDGNTQVIYLKYIRSKDIAPILANIIESYEAKITNDQGLARQNKSSFPTVQTNQNTSNQRQSAQFGTGFSGQSATSTSASTSTGGQTGSNLNTMSALNAYADSSDNRQKSGSFGSYVQWEETTNAVIVQANPSLMRVVRQVIAKLDIRRPQVLVETIIAEISMSRARELGVEWNAGDATFRMATRFPSPSGLSTIAGTLPGPGVVGAAANAFAPGTGLTLGIFRNGNLQGLLRALSTDVSSNILSTPNIVTLDNETANIKVGQLVPFALGQTNNDDQGGNPFTSFTREEVGLSLTIRPQITKFGAIKLYINHILSNVIQGTATNNPGGNPTTSERVITTNVMVENGQILVLGGLISTDWSQTNRRVPIFGDIPGIGNLFKSRVKSQEKRNLMIFLRPVILRDSLDGAIVSGNKYNHIRQGQLDNERQLERPFVSEQPALPQLSGLKVLPPPDL